jgi:hypothetical protein
LRRPSAELNGPRIRKMRDGSVVGLEVEERKRVMEKLKEKWKIFVSFCSCLSSDFFPV